MHSDWWPTISYLSRLIDNLFYFILKASRFFFLYNWKERCSNGHAGISRARSRQCSQCLRDVVIHPTAGSTGDEVAFFLEAWPPYKALPWANTRSFSSAQVKTGSPATQSARRLLLQPTWRHGFQFQILVCFCCLPALLLINQASFNSRQTVQISSNRFVINS